MKLQHWLGLCAVLATGVLFWSLREVLIHLFAAVVLAMALCTLVGALRQRWNLPRPLALLACVFGLQLLELPLTYTIELTDEKACKSSSFRAFAADGSWRMSC